MGGCPGLGRDIHGGGGGREDNIKRDLGEKGLEHSGIWNFPPKLNHTVPNRKKCPSCL